MAVYFRHGSNGAYKTAYAVWFEILPALRQGRIVVTNIEASSRWTKSRNCSVKNSRALPG